MTRTNNRLGPFFMAALCISSVGVAQDEGQLSKLSDPDSAVVEDTCRRLLIGPQSAVSAAKLILLLEDKREVTRWAAARLLLRHRLGREGLHAALMRVPAAQDGAGSDVIGSRSGAFRAMLVPVARDAELPVLAIQDGPLELRIAALRELENRQLLTDGLVLALLGDQEDAIGEGVARILVEERVPFPVPLARRAEGVDFGVARICSALAERPRSEAVVWLGELFETGEVSAEERLWAFAALGPAGIGVKKAREILDGVRIPELRSAALHAADQLSPKVADRLVPELHKRCLQGGSASELLDCLDRISAVGEQQLLGLARALPEDPREEIAEWLTTRSSGAVNQLVEEALSGSFALEPYLIRRSMPFLKEEEHRETVLAFLASGDPDEAVAAFSALIDAGVYDARMLAYALDDEDKRATRLRRLLELPFHALPQSLFVTMLKDEDRAIVGVALGSLRPGPMVHDLEPYLLHLTADLDSSLGLRAAEKLFAAGRSQVVEELFVRMTGVPRQRVLGSLRERKEPWVMALLKRDDSIASQYTRLYLGDSSVFDGLIADPAKWPLQWLHRCDDLAQEHLLPKHLSSMERVLILHPIDSERRAILTGWLAQRPELACAALLLRLYEKDSDEEVVYEALRGLLVRAEGKVIRDRCQKQFGAGLSEAEKDLAYEVVGAMSRPLTVADAAFLAELMMLVPLADPLVESSLHLPNASMVRTPDLPLLNMFWQLIRKGLGEDAEAQIRATAKATAEHANRHSLGRRRLGGLLTMFARDEALRASLAPAVAKLVVMSPDYDPVYLGPAHFILGEQAATAEDWGLAADEYARAVRYFMQSPPRPSVVRIILGENLQGDGQLPAAMLTSLPHEYRARAALAAGDLKQARAAMKRARSLAFGDRETLRVLDTLQQEIDR